MAKNYLTIDEAAQQLDISTDALTHLREKGELRGYADRGTWKFQSKDVTEFLRSREINTDIDARLILDESLAGEEEDGADDSANSDSDVRLADVDQSDNDFKLIDESDSDIRLSDESDSDVKVIGDDADSFIRLVDDSQPSAVTDSDSDVKLVGTESDSDIRLLDQETAGNDITLASSGIDLLAADDSGISLDLANKLTETMPMLQGGEDVTQLEVPVLDGDEELDDTTDFELAVEDVEGGSMDTSVLLFDDEDDFGDPDPGATVDALEGEIFELEDDEELEALDVFDAGGEEFDEDFQVDETPAEFVGPSRMSASVEDEWGAVVFIPLVIATCFMCICGLVMFDLVRSIWGWHEPSELNGPVLDLISGFFK